MNHTAIVIVLLAFAGLPAHATPVDGVEVIEPSSKKLKELLALTPDEVVSDTSVEVDELEPVATLTTQGAWKNKGKLSDRVRADNFLRAFVTRSTGEVRYQLYQEVTYSGDWRRFETVNYATPAGPKSAALLVLSRDVVTCAYGPCVIREIVAFDLTREQLQDVAAQYVPGASPLWRFRFKAQSGLDWEDRLAPAEAAGLLLAVDQFLDRLAPGSSN